MNDKDKVNVLSIKARFTCNVQYYGDSDSVTCNNVKVIFKDKNSADLVVKFFREYFNTFNIIAEHDEFFLHNCENYPVHISSKANHINIRADEIFAILNENFIGLPETFQVEYYRRQRSLAGERREVVEVPYKMSQNLFNSQETFKCSLENISANDTLELSGYDQQVHSPRREVKSDHESPRLKLREQEQNKIAQYHTNVRRFNMNELNAYQRHLAKLVVSAKQRRSRYSYLSNYANRSDENFNDIFTLTSKFDPIPDFKAVSAAYCCSKTGYLMYDPVKASDGFIYERNFILQWIAKSGLYPDSPMTGEILASTDVNPAMELRESIKKDLEFMLYVQTNTRKHSNGIKRIDAEPVKVSTAPSFRQNTLIKRC